MPSSKRNRVIPTSKTRKNHKELVQRLAANIEAAAETYNYVWVFDVENMRNTFLKQVRTDFNDGRLFMGKTKVMSVALGRNQESEILPGITALKNHLKGEVGLLFTDRDPEEVKTYFETKTEPDYARSGATASMDFRIPPGELHTAYGVDGGEEDPLPLSIDPQLRKLGVPTRIVKGKIALAERPEDAMAVGDDEESGAGFLVCREGEVLDSRQTTILKIFGVRMSHFRMGLKAVYDKAKESVEAVSSTDVE